MSNKLETKCGCVIRRDSKEHDECRCDDDGENWICADCYNGEYDDEEDSEYMLELIECHGCDIEKPRKDMHWNTIGSYSHLCKECEAQHVIWRQEHLNRPPTEKVECVVCEKQEEIYSIGFKCKTCKNSMCRQCCCEYSIANPNKFAFEGDETGYAVDIFIPCPMCRTINAFCV